MTAKKNLALLVAVVFFLAGCANQVQTNSTLAQEPPRTPSADELCFPKKCVQIERALTAQEQSRGLMFREGISQDDGMLFVFPNEGRRFFWMKNVSFPIDIIWVSSDKTVAGISKATPCESDPCPTYPSPEGVKYVVEVASGFSEKNGVVIGTRVLFS